MPLQNRVDPLNNIVANDSRGMLMGNRGCLHDDQKQIAGKRWTTHSWVTCALSFNGRKRELMAPRNYTELFFLDEATALAAGHRPCWECRRNNYTAFISASKQAHKLPMDEKLTVKEIDKVMHRDRTTAIADRAPILGNDLPDAAMVIDGEKRIWVRWQGAFYQWSFEGYGTVQDQFDGPVKLVTPNSTMRVLRHGYRAGMHPTLCPPVLGPTPEPAKPVRSAIIRKIQCLRWQLLTAPVTHQSRLPPLSADL
ncbi:hypothetical protein ACFB49_32630 [Sphingomonas sp. DBB INV C78]|uniref:hypothetical protein n=1 Tax=Sphingomonas sp. DBB INV C78 TaxID=3349434 RepID=UPI0036D317D3